uniref:Uncharacterized protein n=1 Tax=Timema cristinae TaxID=61476 RepID=A0A7R9GVN3_TIMCR|nr:unnamed protein product [Timema cristinae]
MPFSSLPDITRHSVSLTTADHVTRYGSGWHVASTEIISSYRAFSREKIVAELGAFIGLGHVNITLRDAHWSVAVGELSSRMAANMKTLLFPVYINFPFPL